MSEWIDFVVYSAQAIVLWVYMPRWCARMALPMMRDRNAAWVDAHPDALAHAPPGAWFLKACYAWGMFTVLALLATRLGLQPEGLLPHRADMGAGWKMLLSTNNMLLSLGMLGYLGGSVVFLRWLRKSVPRSELRQATLQPRVLDDYVPRWFRMLAWSATCAHLAAWLYAGVAGRFQQPDFWPFFSGILVMTIGIVVAGRATVLRRPSQMDRIPGDYRRAEIRLVYAIQLVVVGIGATGLAKVLYGLDLRRFGALAFAVFVAVAFYSMMRPRSREAHPSSTALTS